MKQALLFLALSVVLMSCSEQADTVVVATPGAAPDAAPPPPPVAPDPCFRIDFLFVIDDSGSMYEEQSSLLQNFPRFLDVMNNYVNSAGAFLDYRIAVTTTGVLTAANTYETAMDGAFVSSCGREDRPWVERLDEDISEVFTCRANVGTEGPYLEMPLLAMKRSLGERVADGTNSGFLREDALLAVIILTDEDDCTDYDGVVEDPECHSDVSEYADFLDNLTGDRSRWSVAVMAGDSDCSSSFGSASEATRLKGFVTATGDNGVFASICQGDLSPSLGLALDTFSAACEEFGGID